MAKNSFVKHIFVEDLGKDRFARFYRILANGKAETRWYTINKPVRQRRIMDLAGRYFNRSMYYGGMVFVRTEG